MRRSPWLEVVHLKYRGHIVLCEIEMFGVWGGGSVLGRQLERGKGKGKKIE
jgi:hypothetical protein